MRTYAVVESRPSGVGTTVYVGELRTADDRPITEHLNGNPDGRIIAPVTVGTSEADVLRKLNERTRRLRLDSPTIQA